MINHKDTLKIVEDPNCLSNQSKVKVESLEQIKSPMEVVKQCMLEEIKAIRETRRMLKNKYPELFSLYLG
jgi:hypothetical protein